MAQRLFLLDGMALVYRAHFAFAHRPIRTAAGFNTSALFGFTSTLLDILQSGQPTHLAVALDTQAPTARHIAYPEYKAQREAMPEELAAALPHLHRWLNALNIPCLLLDGYEADDIIGTLVHQAEPAGFESFMVTSDKDFGQLVSDKTVLWKPGKQGSDTEILKPADVCARWNIARVEQVIDMLGLMGDASDNIPGVPGVGEKTAAKLLAQFDTLEGVLASASQVKGKLGEALRTHADLARLSRKLATIDIHVPLRVSLDDLALRPRQDEAVQALCVEFEFNALGRRLYGDSFKAGRGFKPPASTASPSAAAAPKPRRSAPAPTVGQGDLFASPEPAALPATSTEKPLPNDESTTSEASPADAAMATPTDRPALKTITEVPHDYRIADTEEGRRQLASELAGGAFCFDTETDGLDPRVARLLGIAFSQAAGSGWYVPISPRPNPAASPAELETFRELFERGTMLKVGHNLKFDLAILRAHGVEVAGPFFDTMIAHALVEPELRHGMDYLSEALLGYTPIPIEHLIGPKGPGQKSMADIPVDQVATYAAEDADVTWQLRERLAPALRDQALERVFFEVEMPVLPALVAMEAEGIRVDAAVLADLSRELAKEMAAAEADVHRLAGHPFNVHSPKQLGTVLFDELKLVEKPRKTPSGQYATDEQTLQLLAADHEIVRRLLDHRTVSKLKSTYTDALPEEISPLTGRVHTTFHQAATATGRLSSVDPNLQNIPIRTDRGQEIRRAFIAREGWQLLSADYSQIELRIIAALAREEAMIEAFRQGLDIHAATAARVFGVGLEAVTPEMRRRAKMVNFGIAYGISAFGLAQRLAIPRGEASEIIRQYFESYPGIRRYMDDTIANAKTTGYVQTLTGRRRHLRDITSANANVRGAAERNAINTPIQGTAADMIKIAMARIHGELQRQALRSRLLLQVHDELIFDLAPGEESALRALAEEKMRTALPLPGDVPILVEIGTGTTWLDAH
jgi:DNA polymerase-1